jgi:transketolase
MFTQESDFVLGKAQYFSEGTDVSIFACGHLVWNAIQAGVELEAEGISVEIVNLHTIKPLDEESIIRTLKKTGCAVTAEEHNIIGGMGDAVAQVAAKHCPTPIEYVGTNDTFGESGTPAQLLKKYGLDVPDIVAAAKRALARKKS